MKVLILAAGYGTRLYPLTLNQPKPLLKVGSRSIANHILDKIRTIGGISEIFVVTNEKFSKNFEDWAKNTNSDIPIKVINDKTLTNETRLGAIGDIDLVVNSQKLSDDLLVIAGDNLFDLDLKTFTEFARSKAPNATVAVRIVNDPEKIKKYGVVLLKEGEKIADFEEKPKKPKSNLAAMCIYYFPKESLNLVKEYMSGGGTKDAPGNYIAWLSRNGRACGYKFEGEWFDIGDMKSYKLADRIYKKKNNTDTHR